MATTYSSGVVTAYGAALEGGFTGTYEDFCQLMATLPTEYGNIEGSIAQPYSSSNTYPNIGKYVWHNGILYKNIVPITTAESWTAAHWTEAVIGDDVGDLRTAFVEYQDAISEYNAPTNLFNKDSTLIRNGYKFQANGDYIAFSGSSVSHPIKIDHSKAYCFKYYISFYGATANRIIRRCDASGNLILTSPMYVSATDVGTSYGYIDFSEKPNLSDWEYFCVQFRTTGLNDMIIAEGTTLPSYSSYFDPYWKIKESALPVLPLPSNAQNNILYGKKAAFTGDSICYGAGFSGGYPKIIGENNGMTISNTAQTGATLATGTTTDGVNRGWICNKVANMPSDYDYYIVEGGVNDAASDVGVQLGTLTSGYTATLDTTTLYGAMEQICKTLQTTFLGKKYGFLLPHNCYGQSHRWNTEFRPAIKECCKKWGIPYLDLSEKTAQLYNISALRIYTSNGDGWHPTEDGYKLFYVDKIEAWMKTL